MKKASSTLRDQQNYKKRRQKVPAGTSLFPICICTQREFPPRQHICMAMKTVRDMRCTSWKGNHLPIKYTYDEKRNDFEETKTIKMIRRCHGQLLNSSDWHGVKESVTQPRRRPVARPVAADDCIRQNAGMSANLMYLLVCYDPIAFHCKLLKIIWGALWIFKSP